MKQQPTSAKEARARKASQVKRITREIEPTKKPTTDIAEIEIGQAKPDFFLRKALEEFINPDTLLQQILKFGASGSK